MDFFRIKERQEKKDVVEIYPDFRVTRSKDLMVRGKTFYAVWDEEAGLWTRDEYEVARLIDQELDAYRARMGDPPGDTIYVVKHLSDYSTGTWVRFKNYINSLSDSSTQLDENLTFSNSEVKKSDYVSRRLPYPLQEGSIDAYDEIMSALYDPEEREKLEWAIGAIVAGDARHIQKFVVLYGSAGKGKSTFLNIVQDLFEGYYATFEAKALTSANNSFSMEPFKHNPMVAIQHDGDLSKIEDNTRLNSIVSHEMMTMNEKHKPAYDIRLNAFLFMGSNKAVKITDAKSGIIRRLIDVKPSGRLLAPRRYHTLMKQVEFELGAIAWHCLQVYLDLGKDHYAGYKPVEMMLQTDVFFNYIEHYYELFKEQNGATLDQAYKLWKAYKDEAGVEYNIPRHRFREELKNYFDKFEDRAMVDGIRVYSWYSGFVTDLFKVTIPEEPAFSLVMDEHESLLDDLLADCPAQYTNAEGTRPHHKWENVTTTLKDLDTSREHYVKVPEDLITIDFDKKDEDGSKSLEKNLEAASRWPHTYAELSKSGEGIHLEYFYEGDVSQLSAVYEEGVEIKVYKGNSSLRRRVTRCNNVPVARINGGLPLKEKKVLNGDTVKSERSLREQVERNLRKEIHPNTKPSVDFIKKILDDAYDSGLVYDLTDMKAKVIGFANGSSNQALECLRLVNQMKFASEVSEDKAEPESDRALVFFDVEVFPNLLQISWKIHGANEVVRMFNPTPVEVENLARMKLVGFNNRRYDNHILYARILGYNNAELFDLSQKLIENAPNATFREAWNLSHADIFDFASIKMSLKKWQIELGIPHKELGLPWDKPVPEELWPEVANYCDNDVRSTEATFEDRLQDYVARQILSDLSGLSVNSTTQQHTARIVFEGDPKAQEEFVYTDLSKEFPGYEFKLVETKNALGKTVYTKQSTYLGEEVGEGGYVYAEPGMYENVVTLDVASMHPTSIRELELFGKYTKNFEQLMRARLAIKRGEWDVAKAMLDGKLAPHLGTEETAEALSYALKIVINIVYGLTAATFDNPFRDPRNKDNIVAKRGALMMVLLQHKLQEMGVQVIHIKTDSIKLQNPTKEIIDFVMEFGEEYGYTFEHEATYERFCLVNDAVYIAKTAPGRKPSYWEAVGAQFQHPYVYKTLFTKEPIGYPDYCEAKSVTTSLWLDFTETDDKDTPMVFSEEQESKRVFVGKVGEFIPVTKGGGELVREKDGQFHSATGAKGYKWLEATMVRDLKLFDDIDMSYYTKLVDAAKDKISSYGDWEWFVD